MVVADVVVVAMIGVAVCVGGAVVGKGCGWHGPWCCGWCMVAVVCVLVGVDGVAVV